MRNSKPKIVIDTNVLLISNDKHFKILKTVEFPVIPIVTFQKFEAVYKA